MMGYIFLRINFVYLYHLRKWQKLIAHERFLFYGAFPEFSPAHGAIYTQIHTHWHTPTRTRTHSHCLSHSASPHCSFFHSFLVFFKGTHSTSEHHGSIQVHFQQNCPLSLSLLCPDISHTHTRIHTDCNVLGILFVD